MHYWKKKQNNSECKICLMDSSAPDLVLDEYGVCNYCHLHKKLDEQYPLNKEGTKLLNNIIAKIKTDGKGKKYDCIIGISGGTDSTYTLLMAKNFGLRPLAVHFDNGWNSEIAVSNIQKSIEKLGFDLYTYVVDWEEFKNLQLAFLRASVPEVELPTDIGIRTTLYMTATKYKIKYIIEGTSFRTEGIVPHGWGYKDGKYVRSINNMFSQYKLKSFPNLELLKYAKYTFINRIQLVRLLNYFDYTKEKAKDILKEELDWVDYGGHHHESIYTKFFQSYLAPYKFNMDRKKVTLSAMIRENKITKEEAKRVLVEKYYNDKKLNDDIEYISKKFGLSKSKFIEIIKHPPKSFFDYPSYYYLINRSKKIIDFLNRKGFINGIFQSGELSIKNEK